MKLKARSRENTAPLRGSSVLTRTSCYPKGKDDLDKRQRELSGPVRTYQVPVEK